MIKKRIDGFEVLQSPSAPVPMFSAGGVSEILGVKSWRLQKFLNSPRYRLGPSGQLGRGQGSRRLFSTQDIYRIGVAVFLANDGFAPKLIVQILQEIEDEDFLAFEEQGEVYTGIKLIRTATGPKLGFFRSGNFPKIKPGSDVYYALDLVQVTGKIDRRIEEMKVKTGKR